MSELRVFIDESGDFGVLAELRAIYAGGSFVFASGDIAIKGICGTIKGISKNVPQ